MSAKGYWIGNNDIHDEKGLWAYRAANKEVMTRYGAKFIMMAGQQTIVEDPDSAVRTNTTVVEFPSYQAAVDCFEDVAYQEAVKLRHAAAVGLMLIVEGYDGPQDFG